ncbi:MAG: pyridoxamine 5'-phosphate oxidase [Pseudomonadota bacterium]|nr:pyridoxamine 5'-phosphate oxidase [Pseudomonadota bacterium]
MSHSAPLIPPSPTREDYLGQMAANADDSVFAETDPFALFGRWLAEARAHEPNDPNAFALATADADGAPDVRMVLLKALEGGGFTFYTNLESAKGRQLAANPQAALLFHWKTLRRQVRARGRAEPVGPEEADAYFAQRARDARLGAIASDQSRPLPSREALERRIADLEARYAGADPPRPAHWSGWRIIPDRFEFWRDRPFRLHDRLVFERSGEAWRRGLLYP